MSRGKLSAFRGTFRFRNYARIALMEKNAQVWDVCVIGGGPAGMMAAGRAAERGATVILLEKNEGLGKKLLITGGGRCNVTNAEFDDRKLLDKFKENGKYLFSAFSQFSVKEALDFFHERKMETKVEALQRVFPLSNSAQSVWNVLVEYLKQGKVEVMSKSAVTGFEVADGNPIRTDGSKEPTSNGARIVAAKVGKNRKVFAKNFILATGGESRPETGSTGDGFKWLKEIGHTVIPPSASLVPIAIDDAWVKRLQGVTLQKVKITLFQNDVKQSFSTGRILFTHFGISGPTILNMSSDVAELLKYGDVKIVLDIVPEFGHDKLNLKLQEIFKENDKKKFKNSLSSLAPSALAPVLVELSKINADTACNSITREERLRLVTLLKAIPLSVKGLLGTDKAIVTSGGVSLDEVDFKTMRSRKFSNLFLVGDILNIDRPSGGYSLQLCWTTGAVAGNSIEIPS